MQLTETQSSLLHRVGILPHSAATALQIQSFEQGSDPWLAARQRRLGASEVAAIAGLSKYQTAQQLLDAKLGQPQKQTAAMRRGQRVEVALIEEYKQYVLVRACLGHILLRLLLAWW